MGWLIAAVWVAAAGSVTVVILSTLTVVLTVLTRPDPPAPPVRHDITPFPSLLYGPGALHLRCSCGWYCTLAHGDTAVEICAAHLGMT